eukprot:4452051-Amphidinium_carterae.1
MYDITPQPFCYKYSRTTSNYVGDAMEAGQERIVYDLNEQNLEYITHLSGDTAEDDTRLRQIEVLEDDLQSIDDVEYYRKRQEEEEQDPEGTYWRRSQLEGHRHEMDEAYRWKQARRDEG